MKWLLSCFLTILLLFQGATSSNTGPVRLTPLQYWKGTPEPSKEASSNSGQEALGIYFNLFKGECGYGTLGDEETLKKQAAECLHPEKLVNFQVNDAELQFTFPLSQDARCVMWFVLAMRRSGLRYTLDTKTKTFNISLHVFTKGKGCAAKALPTSGDKFRFCIVKKCDSENVSPIISEQHVIHDSRAITPNTNPMLDDFCDLECRYESFKIRETANGAQIVVKPKKGYRTVVTNAPGTTVDIKPAAVKILYTIATTLIGAAFLVLFIFGALACNYFRKISTMMAKLRELTYPETFVNEKLNNGAPSNAMEGVNHEDAENASKENPGLPHERVKSIKVDNEAAGPKLIKAMVENLLRWCQPHGTGIQRRRSLEEKEDGKETANQQLHHPLKCVTTLTAWFALNQRDPNARHHLYGDMPRHYT
ncbi:hypothetical protein QR680_018880 [Steinernema hermaphroditum]|uniref:ZP domain-containing protein n=1 Tax=Steinernema hermaphroditum TaxID=289476 RepID=A0AA39HK88_9BILA|nr:hypothetical protein QR680_018880 [Steinernema hermaphroditum]